MYPDFRSQRRFRCKARFVAGGAAAQLCGEVHDVSAYGLCLVTDVTVSRGRELHLEFQLPTGQVKAVAEVRWCAAREGRQEVGLRFVRINAPSLAAIEEAISVHPYRNRLMRDYVFR